MMEDYPKTGEQSYIAKAEVLDHDEAIAQMWSFYTEKVSKIDEEAIEEFKGEADGILVFTGLFAGTVATFLVDSYKNLQQDPNDIIIAHLAQISAQLNGTSITGPISPFQPPDVAVRVNVLWFISLCLSLGVALNAVMTQTWCRRYLQLCKRSQTTPGLQARIRVFLFAGVERYKMDDLVGFMPSVLHAAVLLFLFGFVDLLFPINVTVAGTVLAFVALILVYFLALTISPLVQLESPYSTPFSWILWRSLSVSMNHLHRKPFTLPSSRSDDTNPLAPVAPLRHRFEYGPRGTIERTIANRLILPSEFRALITVVSNTLRTPPDVASFFDGLALTLGASKAPAEAAAEILSAGRACLLSATRVLLPRAEQNIRSWLRLCFALQRATGTPVVRDELFPSYVQPVMSAPLKIALECESQHPEPHLAVTARVLLAYNELEELRSGNPYEEKTAILEPNLTPGPSAPRTSSASVALALVGKALQLWPGIAPGDRLVSIGMVADCVEAVINGKGVPFGGGDDVTEVSYQHVADNLKKAVESGRKGEYGVLVKQMDRIRAQLGISDAPPGSAHG